MMTRAAYEAQEKAIVDFVKKYGPGRLKRGRGRAKTGVSDAIPLAIQVEEFRQMGMTRPQAVEKVHKLTGKSTTHISLCHSMVTEHDLDRLEKKRTRMAEYAREQKSKLRKRPLAKIKSP